MSIFPGAKVKVRGERDVHVGHEGEVVRCEGRHNYWVRIGNQTFRKPGRVLAVMSQGRPPEKKSGGHDGVSAAIDRAYRRKKETDPNYAAFMNKFDVRTTWRW